MGLLLRALGDSDALLRLSSALAGAATVPLLYRLGRRLCDRRTGAAAAILLAFHPLHVFYSREARVYTLLLLLVVATWLALWRALEEGSWTRWVGYALLLTAVCYAHFYGLFVAAAAALIVGLWGGGWRARVRGGLASMAAVAAFAPYLVFTLGHLRDSGADWSVARLYQLWPEERGLGRVVEQELIGASYNAPIRRQTGSVPIPGWLGAAAMVAQATLLAAALHRGLKGTMRPVGFLVIAWLVPVLLPWSITHLGRAIFHPGRHDVYVLGALCLLLAAGLAHLAARGRPGRAAATLLAATLALAAGVGLVSAEVGPPGDFHRASGRWIAERASPHDRVIALGIRRLVTERYARLAGSEVPFGSFPASTDDHPGWADPDRLLADPAALAREAVERVGALGREARGGPFRLFVLFREYPRSPGFVSDSWLVDQPFFRALDEAGWRRLEGPEDDGLEIAVYAPPSGAAEGGRSR